jgi:hypothetical protein
MSQEEEKRGSKRKAESSEGEVEEVGGEEVEDSSPLHLPSMLPTQSRQHTSQLP